MMQSSPPYSQTVPLLDGWVPWVLWPAVTMAVGWGLRGYIGGGPFGAMIAGALVALALCMLLGYRGETAAVLAAFGAVGVGFGGDMTYGQTISLLGGSDTLAWGLTGLTVKGAVWGLLGGAVLGVGLRVKELNRQEVFWMLALFLLGVFAGIAIINEPKLIYFSDPVNKPRDESWAGLLFGALFLLAYVKVSVPSMFGVVGRFALYGLAAGGIGFGGGALWMVLSSRVDTLAWLPYWKFMEFSFGFCFGAGLGLCAWHLRRGLPHYAPLVDPHAQAKSAGLAAGAVLVGVFLLWPLLVVGIATVLREAPLPWLVTPLGRTLLGYTGLGCVLLGLARSSPTLAWQIAATVTFIATTIDLRADLFPGSGAAVTVTLWGFVLLLGVVAAVLVLQWQRRAGERLVPLFVSLLWALMAVAYLRGISTSPAWNASSGAEAFQQIRAELIVHGIFTLFAILSTWGAVRFHEAAKHRT